MPRPRLKRREWIIVAVGISVLILILVAPTVRDLFRTFDRAENQLRLARINLIDAGDLKTAILDARTGQQAVQKRIDARVGRFDLYSFTNQTLRTLKLADRANLQSTPLGAQEKLDRIMLILRGVSMEELTGFLHQIYSSNNLITIQRLDHLRPARDGQGLDCQITFIAPK